MDLISVFEILFGISQKLDYIQNQLDVSKKNENVSQKVYLTIRDFAEYANMPLSTAYKISSKNVLSKYRTGKRILFKKSEIDQWIQSNKISSNSEIKSKAVTELMKAGHHE